MQNFNPSDILARVEALETLAEKVATVLAPLLSAQTEDEIQQAAHVVRQLLGFATNVLPEVTTMLSGAGIGETQKSASMSPGLFAQGADALKRLGMFP